MFIVLLLKCAWLSILVRSNGFLYGRTVIISSGVLSILKLQLGIVVLNSKLVYFSVFLLTNQNTFVKELTILPRVEGIILHLMMLSVVTLRNLICLINNLRRFKLICLVFGVFVMKNRIQTFLLITFIQNRSSHDTFVDTHAHAI